MQSKRKYLIILLLLFLTSPALADKHKLKNLKKLTVAEIADVNDVLANMAEDKAWIEEKWRSKDFRNTNVRCKEQAIALKAFQVKVNAGQINRKNKAGETVPATMADVIKVTRLDRWYSGDPDYIQDFLLGIRNWIDGTLVNPVGVPE